MVDNPEFMAFLSFFSPSLLRARVCVVRRLLKSKPLKGHIYPENKKKKKTVKVVDLFCGAVVRVIRQSVTCVSTSIDECKMTQAKKKKTQTNNIFSPIHHIVVHHDGGFGFLPRTTNQLGRLLRVAVTNVCSTRYV